MANRFWKVESLFWLLTAACVLFIFSASFYSASWGNLLDSGNLEQSRLSLWLNGDLTFRHLRDIATNVLLYMPFGLLVACTLSFRSRLAYFHPAIAAGFGLSMIIETIQAFVGRFSDPTDVLSNGLGFVIGYLLMVYAVRQFHLSPAHLLGLSAQDGGGSRSQTLRGIRFLYLSTFVVVALVPLDFAVGITQIFAKLKPVGDQYPRLILDPWFHWKQSPVAIQTLLLSALAFVPVALLTALIDRSDGVVSFSRPVLHCVALALATEIGQVFIASGRSDIFVPLLAALSGALVAWVVHRVAAGYESAATVSRPHEATRYLALLLGLYLVFVLSLAWAPYDFESPGAWKRKLLSETNLIPFRLHFGSRSVAAAVDIVREVALLLPLGVLAGLLAQSLVGPLRWLPRALLGGTLGLAVGLAVEGSQSIVVGRYIDITDALLGALGCFLGCVAWPAVVPRIGGSRSMTVR